MKAEIKIKEKVKKYPYIGYSKSISGLIILFYKPQCGVILQDCENSYSRPYAEDWYEDNFDLFTGKIVLEND